ncbi:family S53 protease [Mycena alexandri]|uniref:Family S53 protease n=1 Tax=Mycena alexandri TaxID=1745969 RepID=A0AAD6XAM1_9AGAR|nr:family S53 protease [Mycena alexandri]
MLPSILLLFPLLVAATSGFHVLERRDSAPAGFTRIGSPQEDQVLSLRLALTQGNITGLHDTVYAISTPGNSRYGNYLTREEVTEFVAPSSETLSSVNSWLASNNLTASPITTARDWLLVNMTVSQANALLVADFSTFQSDATNETVIRTLSYSVPAILKSSIEWVHPTISFPQAKSSRPPSSLKRPTTAASAQPPASSVSADCRMNSSWTPVCLQELYGIPSTPAKPTTDLFGVSGFDNDFANLRDLQTFLEIYRPDMNPNTTFGLITLDGGLNNQLPGGAGLTGNPDTQYAVGLTNGVPVTFISTGTLPDDLLVEMLDQANYLVSLENPPRTILNTETPQLESLLSSPQIAISMCNAYAQLAARGVSYIVQTNIWGAGSVPIPDCKSFDASFPATCPFVTAVGATEFNNDEPEEVASQFSGGGFSDLFKRPKYQDSAVSGYLKATDNTDSSAFNVSGRAIPDVAAIAAISWIFDGGVVDFLEATEYSATIFASIVALLNNERIAAGKPGLGFLNPLIYSNGDAFNDMKTGSNPGCNTPGFNSTVGWDPVTGFGSPSYPRLQDVCSKL